MWRLISNAMGKETTVFALILFITAGLGGCKEASEVEGELITVDLTTSLPKKELVVQDFLDVEYIPLETNDEFITQGVVMAVGDQYMIVKNWSNDGNLFVFDRKTGKAIRKINRKGQGAEEYAYINSVVLDEEHNELFVNSTSTKKIFVYDLSGNFKRSFDHTEGTEYMNIYNCDKDHLIRYDYSGYQHDGENRDGRIFHAVISKQDGRVTRELLIPFDVISGPVIKQGEGVVVAHVRSITPYNNNMLLAEMSSDTIYHYAVKEDKLSPFLVKKTTGDPEIILTMGIMTDRYYFMQTMKKTFDFTTGRGFGTNDIMYDNEDGAVFGVTVRNGDFIKKGFANMTSNPVNHVIAGYQNLAAHQLVEAYENDELTGELKEVAATLDEEANPVIMLMKYKK